MTNLKEQCVYVCGPFKNYCGRADYDDSAGLFHGEVIGTRDVITFQGRTLGELRKAFVQSVKDYLSFCKASGTRPEKPFSGKFVARIHPEVHRKISVMAQTSGKSLNQFVCDCLEAIAETGRVAPTSTSKASRRSSRRTSIA